MTVDAAARGRHAAATNGSTVDRRKVVYIGAAATLLAACTPPAVHKLLTGPPKTAGASAPVLPTAMPTTPMPTTAMPAPITPPPVATSAAPTTSARVRPTSAPSTSGSTHRAGSPSPTETGSATEPAGAAAAPTAVAPRTIADAATLAAASTTPLANDPAAHLLARFSFGATPAALAEVRSIGLDTWVNRQLAPTATGYAAVGVVATMSPLLRQSGAQVTAANPNSGGTPQMQLVQATLAMQLWSPWQLYESMVDFWANHLYVPATSDNVNVRHVFDRDVIRRYALSNFRDLLLASAKDPSMLLNLNQAESTKAAPNENYARELMELHTVGFGNYTESDVHNVSRLLTGRTVINSGYVYQSGNHATGAISALGFRSANATAAGGEAAADSFLRYLAAHPDTAQMIARKLAVRFVSDQPPAALVNRLAATYLAHDTAIVPVLRTLLMSPEFWSSRGQKTRRPAENVIAAMRALNARPAAGVANGLADLRYSLMNMGNAPMGWSPPSGYPDVAAAWVSSATLVQLWGQHRYLTAGGQPSSVVLDTPKTIWAGAVPSTMGAAVDYLAQRLLGHKLPSVPRQALLTYLGATDKTPVRSADLDGQFQGLVALLFDSIYHALR